MKILYYSTCSCSYPHMGVMLNSIIEDVKNGHEVIWVYCDCAVPSCFMNPRGSKAYCRFCKYSYKHLIAKYGKGVNNIISLSSSPKPSVLFNYHNSEELKYVEYNGVKVGLSILSYYISYTREMNFEIDDILKNKFDNIIQYVCGSVDSFMFILQEYQPELIKSYNGRYYENRFIYDLAISKGIVYHSLEVVGGHGEPYYPIHFPGNLPHSISLNTLLINKTWTESKKSDDTKKKIASTFYEKRANGLVSCDVVYTSSQILGLLPCDFDRSKRNIAIFNSSADEMAAIGGEWEDATTLFSSQYECVKYILQHASNDMHFYLRIHPNLKDIKYTYHTDLYKLSDEFKNITIIEPKSPISSYALMNACEKVVVFGSTMGVEACFWGKPVILIGTAFYAFLDVCYKVTNKEDILKLLIEDLPPKSSEGAMKYAYYLLNRNERVDKYNNIDVNYKILRIFGKKIKVSTFNTLFHSCYLHAIINKFFISIVSRFL